MAKKIKARVKDLLDQGFDPRELAAANPSTPVLKPRQEVFVPKRKLDLGEMTLPAFRGAGGGASLGAEVGNTALPPQTAPKPSIFRNDAMQAQQVTRASPAPQPSIFRNDAMQARLTAGGKLLPSNTGQIVALDGTVNPPIPSGVFDPDGTNAQAWRNWWNWQAEHPLESRQLLTQIAISQGKPDPFAVHVPTRQEVWNMKAEARRKKMTEDGSVQAPETFTPAFTPAFGNQVQTISWRIGG